MIVRLIKWYHDKLEADSFINMSETEEKERREKWKVQLEVFRFACFVATTAFGYWVVQRELAERRAVRDAEQERIRIQAEETIQAARDRRAEWNFEERENTETQ